VKKVKQGLQRMMALDYALKEKAKKFFRQNGKNA
jgi:hypothetical protein